MEIINGLLIISGVLGIIWGIFKFIFSGNKSFFKILDEFTKQLPPKKDKKLASQIRKDCVHKLGNLTLTGYNSQLSNMSLDKKQNRKNKEDKYIGFKNGLILNEVIKEIN